MPSFLRMSAARYRLGSLTRMPELGHLYYAVWRYSFIMDIDNISAESLLNLILDEIDDMIIINDSDRSVIWMNCAAQRRLNVSIEEVVGVKCYRLFGATCCCDTCRADHTLGGPHRCGCKFTCRNSTGEFECDPIPYYKDGRLKVLVQHVRPVNKNE
jgi:transcriptional regulator with PAS, ATPase and Fis domain